MAGKSKAALVLSHAERAQLCAWARNRKTAQSLAQRARIVLECVSADNRTVAAQLSVTPLTVSKWRNRFIRLHLDGLHDAPRSGAPVKIDRARIDATIIKALEERPANATYWSSRALAREMGMSQSAISRIWRAFGIAPSRHEPFRLSDDPRFADKVRDIAAFISTRRFGHWRCVWAETRPIGRRIRKHGPSPIPITPGGMPPPASSRRWTIYFHLVLDHHETALTHPEQIWLLRHRSCHVYYTPSPASWINQVKRWHTVLAREQDGDKTSRPTLQLETAVSEHLERLDSRNPEPFVWVKSCDDIKIALTQHAMAKL